jgi:hypothetical protein
MAYKVKVDDIQPAFNNAHRPMWEKHSNGRVLLSGHEADTLPILWWQKEYNVKIHTTRVSRFNKWEYAEFENKEAFTWFMLKWS